MLKISVVGCASHTGSGGRGMPMGGRWARPTLLLACVLCSAATGAVEFNVMFGCGWDGYYRPMEWTPVEIGIESDATEPFAGTLTLSTRQDGLNTLNIVHPFVLTPELQHDFPLVTKIGFGMGQCDLAIRDQRGRLRWNYVAQMWDTSQARLMQSIQEQDLLIGIIGQARFGLLRLPGETVSQSDRGTGRVYTGRKVAATVPRDWTGFVGLDVLVLYDPDWSLLHHESLTAMADWVSNGGTLLLVLGQHPLSRTNPLMKALPFQIGEPLESAIGPKVLAEWGLDDGAPETVTRWPLSARPGALLTRQTDTAEGRCLCGQGVVGFGRVTVLGFDPAQFSDRQADRTAPFWVAQVKACLEDPSAARAASRIDDQVPAEIRRRLVSGAAAARGRNGRTIALAHDVASQFGGQISSSYRVSTAQDAVNRVMTYLYQLSQMRPLSIWWVILILTTLALLLGPVDYFVLKRLDRLPLTWLTSLAWIAVFTIGAYYGVQALRGGSMQLRAVSVLDGVAGGDCAWGTYYSGLFAPRSADYRLEGLGERQWWSGIAPSQEQLFTHQQESALRHINCSQADGANLPVSVPISIWTVQSLLTESPLEAMPFAATVESADGDVIVELTNLSDSAIRRGFVLLADAWADLGTVPAKGTEQFRMRTRPFNLWTTASSVGPNSSGGQVPRYPGRLDMETAFLAQGCLPRSLAMHQYLSLGAALVCVQFEGAPAPFSVEGRSYEVTHVQLARQVVFPRDPS